jgi:hypothetical protein
MPLFEAAAEIVAAAPDAYPLQEYVRLTITSSDPLPDIWREHGYAVPTAMIEVLVDARLLEDEDRGESVVEEVDPRMRGYSIRIEKSDLGRYSIGPSSPPPRSD